MPARLALTAVVACVLAAAGCSAGEDEPAAPPPSPPATSAGEILPEQAFAQRVAAELRSVQGVEAEALRDGTVRVERGLETLSAVVADRYSEYTSDPGRVDELVDAAAGDVLAGLDAALDGESWQDVEADVMPLLVGRFDLRGLPREPLERPFAGDLAVVYVVDRDEDVLAVEPGDVRRWGVGPEEVDRTALANLERRTDPLLCEEQLCGWASGDGYDATRLVSPKLRRDIAAEIGRAVYAVPIRNVFVALPRRLAGRIRDRVLQQFTTGTDPVSPELFVERGGEVVVLPE